MAKDILLIDRLRNGEKIICKDCQKGLYETTTKEIKLSHEFRCNHCGSVVRVTPNVIVE